MPLLTKEALEDIQGILLTGYAHLNFGCYLFLKAKDPAKARQWLQQILPQVRSAKSYERRSDGSKIKPDTTVNIAFTYAGAQALDLPEETLSSFSTEFKEGMVKNANILGDTGDSDPQHWEVGGPTNSEVHILLMLFAIDAAVLAQLRSEQQDLIQRSDGGVVEIALQEGARPLSQKEPFGFHDGISNPTVEGTPKHPEPSEWVIRTGEFVLGYINEYEVYPPSPVVLPQHDPNGILPAFPENGAPMYRDFGRHGSYLAYRKLRQDVAGFWKYAAEKAREIEGTADDQGAIWLASRLVGRWPSGAPLALSPDRDDPKLADENRFTYALDPKGLACPIGAHNRRANPRASIAYNTAEQSISSSNTHRILRRAVSYGGVTGLDVEHDFDVRALDRGELPKAIPSHVPDRGIHFIAVNADLRRQFELVQQNWCNNAAFNGLLDNKDAMIGDTAGMGNMTIQSRPFRKRLLDVPRFVTTRGGSYLFLPSITALRFMVAI
jgi:Dyp-type peroxidase family